MSCPVRALELSIFVFFLLLVTVLGFLAARWRATGTLRSLDEWGLGGPSLRYRRELVPARW